MWSMNDHQSSKDLALFYAAVNANFDVLFIKIHFRNKLIISNLNFIIGSKDVYPV